MLQKKFKVFTLKVTICVEIWNPFLECILKYIKWKYNRVSMIAAKNNFDTTAPEHFHNMVDVAWVM